ncbi:MAG: cold shock and DUF1294 domain-containing protein [Candidatus Accumulibacter sp. UW26]|jgi:uncharacterized membrane protein YsdA (DUF1294 family)/cold shock CspA family protein
MRYQGRITEWKDDKGFGFVAPNGGGPRVFVHIKSFSNRQRRPVGDELVTYELTADSGGRPQGVNIAFVGDRSSSPPAIAPGPGLLALSFAVVFLVFMAGAVAVGKLPFLVLIAYLVVSCVAYLAYEFDKAAAQNGQWRTQESTLHLFSLLGGWPGAMLAQKRLRHKTRKQSFQLTYWATVVLNCAGLGWLLSPSGMRIIKTALGIA